MYILHVQIYNYSHTFFYLFIERDFFIPEFKLSNNDAKQFCNAMRMTLVQIETEEKMEALLQYITEHTDNNDS